VDSASSLRVDGLLRAQNDIRLGGVSGPNHTQDLFFYHNGSEFGEFLEWDPDYSQFAFSAPLATPSGALQEIPPTNRFLSLDDQTGPEPGLSGRLGGNLEIGSSLPADDDLLLFDGGADSFGWSGINNRFEMSAPLAVGTLRDPANPTLFLALDAIASGPEPPLSGRLSRDLELGSESGPAPTQLLFNGGYEAMRWDPGSYRFEFTNNLNIVGDLTATGTKSFIQNHPEDPNLEVRYVALEGDEAATYTRGVARLENGVARIALGETFAWVTDPETGLTANLTPLGQAADLYVESMSTTELVVRGSAETPPDAAFSYLVMGLRLGYQDFAPVRPRSTAAPVPSPASYNAWYSKNPGLRGYSPRARFEAMPTVAGVWPAGTALTARELQASIGEYDSERADPAKEGVHEALVPAPRANVMAASPEEQPVPVARPLLDLKARSFLSSDPGVARLAEISESVEAGDVLALDPDRPGVLRLARTASDPAVLGVAAGKAGMVLGAVGPDGSAESEPGDPSARARVALSGIVSCKVDAGYGAILPGDLLTSSPTPGHAMRADDPRPGTVVAKALQPLDSGTGTILVLVMLR